MRDDSKQRTIRIKVSIRGQNVVCEQTTLVDEMKQEDERFKKQRHAREKKAKLNQAARKKGDTVLGDEFIELRSNPDVGAHPTIHVFHAPKDQLEWFSDDKIDFVVHIQRNPELIYLEDDTPAATNIPTNSNARIENPFDKDFPLMSVKGESVSSGPLRNDDAVFRQRYYKFTVAVEGKNPFDPDLEGHSGN